MKTHMFAAAAAVTALASQAFAAPVSQLSVKSANDAPSVAVPYADLNIATPQGHATLVRRVNNAAADVCGSRPTSLMDVAANQRFNACVSKVAGEALAKVPASAIVAGSTRPNG